MTGRDLISASLRIIGALASGDSLNATDASDALASLNRLLDSWSNDGLLINAITQESPLTLTGGTATYTLGTAGNITTRPMSIEGAMIRDGSVDYPVRVISLDEFRLIPNKTIQATYPQSLYDDGGYPQRTITLYPVPASAKTLILFTKRPITQVATLDTAISLPPGYERALVYGLGVELAPEYGRPVPPQFEQTAIEAKAAIKRSNHRPSYLQVNDLPASTRGGWNIATGEYTR